MSDSRPLALVTGASSGIGLELARQFAGAGFDLVVTAEDAELASAAERLRSGAQTVQTVQADLRTAAGVAAVHAAVQATGRPLAAAALNAGIGHGGPFVENDIEDEVAIIELNVTSTVRLAKLVLRDMVARNEGRLLITSSIASTMPGAFQAVYNASKSFLQSFAEALVEELEDTGVTVTSLMPGPTDTEFFDRAELQDTKIGAGPKDDPAQVAAQGFAALMKGEDKVVAGSLKTKVQGAVNSVLPDRLKSKAHRQMAEPGSAE
ncbi:SDR family NAD(P)-dependent oxidoreductase [Geodermatophilus sabuli]|uniref:SDR family NAD(P)-dependent oxidoreductase n=1 Tax=Geodermatophilus sabuli TaxID=1564158 RepID=A0A7K3VX24_9ACTN|nr:SDR family NAD(P)-dependent oxidoreductase [Geodermatophilus sabuli]NEK57162.1 SDR family NAD(P)-dependent oxidoreductase [Geodermatophilus sabuli]